VWDYFILPFFPRGIQGFQEVGKHIYFGEANLLGPQAIRTQPGFRQKLGTQGGSTY